MNRPLATALAALCAIAAAATDTDSIAAGQLDERLSPQIETAPADTTADDDIIIDYSAYPSLKLRNNHISLNGDSWDTLSRKFAAAARGDGTFTVVYLGDSHVQADFGGAVLRRRLADASRSRGRGFIAPLKLAGTNQPTDYSISTTSPYIASTLMRTPWSTEMAFSGATVQPATDSFTLSLRASSPASRIRIFTRGGELTAASLLNADGSPVAFTACTDSHGILNILPDSAAAVFDITLDGDGHTAIAGLELTDGDTGTLVHSIGNNGATYSSYTHIDRFGSELSALDPDLIIIALGTNEAFGRTTPDALHTDIGNLLYAIRLHSPEAKILLAGPAECYRRTYTRRKGRRRPSGQTVNTKVATIARAIRLYAEANNIPYYNHYAVAGRASALRAAQLLSKDGVHYTRTGYRLWGNLLADAILERLQ